MDLTDEPLFSQYVHYLGNVCAAISGSIAVEVSLTGDRGDCQRHWLVDTPRADRYRPQLPHWLRSRRARGWRRGGFFDRVVPPVLLFVSSFPDFFLALLLFYLLSFRLGWFPMGKAYGTISPPSLSLSGLADVAHHLILPAGTIVLVSLGHWTLSMRNSMIGVLGEDYLTLAEAKGLSPRRILLQHAVRTALLPNITMLGAALGGVFSGQILTEIVFSYPGLGLMLIQAVQTLDYPLMQALFLFITLSVLTANFVVDTLYVVLDPRVRRGA